jgi:hypothetical protein
LAGRPAPRPRVRRGFECRARSERPGSGPDYEFESWAKVPGPRPSRAGPSQGTAGLRSRAAPSEAAGARAPPRPRRRSPRGPAPRRGALPPLSSPDIPQRPPTCSNRARTLSPFRQGPLGSTAVELLTSGHVRFDLTTIRKQTVRFRPNYALEREPKRAASMSAHEGGVDILVACLLQPLPAQSRPHATPLTSGAIRGDLLVLECRRQHAARGGVVGGAEVAGGLGPARALDRRPGQRQEDLVQGEGRSGSGCHRSCRQPRRSRPGTCSCRPLCPLRAAAGYFTNGQPPSFSGRKACSALTVPTSL